MVMSERGLLAKRASLLASPRRLVGVQSRRATLEAGGLNTRRRACCLVVERIGTTTTTISPAAASRRSSQRQRSRHVVSFNSNSETVETAETEGSAAEENGVADSTPQETAEETATEEVSEEPSYKALVEKIKAAAAAAEGDQDLLGELIPELESELEASYTKVKENEAQIAAVNEESTKLKDQYLRLNADFDNYRKRTETEKEALSKNARGNTLEELLPVIDNFELARNQLVLETEAEQKVSDSYQNLYKQLVEILKKLGLETIQSVGATFDPELHDAIMQEETSEHEDNTVLEEYRRGFMFGDRLLRAAMVKVAINSTASTEAANQDKEEGKEDVAAAENENENENDGNSQQGEESGKDQE